MARVLFLFLEVRSNLIHGFFELFFGGGTLKNQV